MILADGSIWVANFGNCDACGKTLGHPHKEFATVGTVISCGHCLHAMIIDESGSAKRLTREQAEYFWKVARGAIEANMQKAERQFWG